MTIKLEVKSPDEFAQECKHKDSCLSYGVSIPDDCLTHCNLYHNYLWCSVRDQLHNGRGEDSCLEKSEDSKASVSQRHSVDCSEFGSHKESGDSERKFVELKFLPYQDTKEVKQT